MSDFELIRRSEVMRITGLRKTTLYNLMKHADDPFPPNYPTSVRGRAWVKSEILQWCELRRNAERKPTPIEEAIRLRRKAG